MAFSQQTLHAARAVANRAEAMWQGVKQVGFDFLSLMTLILGFLKDCRNPATERSREALVKSAYNACIRNGVDKCIECCMPKKQAQKLRKKMAKKKGLKSGSLQDQHFFNAVVAANAEREEALAAMANAYDNDETEEDDDADE